MSVLQTMETVATHARTPKGVTGVAVHHMVIHSSQLMVQQITTYPHRRWAHYQKTSTTSITHVFVSKMSVFWKLLNC